MKSVMAMVAVGVLVFPLVALAANQTGHGTNGNSGQGHGGSGAGNQGNGGGNGNAGGGGNGGNGGGNGGGNNGGGNGGGNNGGGGNSGGGGETGGGGSTSGGGRGGSSAGGSSASAPSTPTGTFDGFTQANGKGSIDDLRACTTAPTPGAGLVGYIAKADGSFRYGGYEFAVPDFVQCMRDKGYKLDTAGRNELTNFGRR